MGTWGGPGSSPSGRHCQERLEERAWESGACALSLALSQRCCAGSVGDSDNTSSPLGTSASPSLHGAHGRGQSLRPSSDPQMGARVCLCVCKAPHGCGEKTADSGGGNSALLGSGQVRSLEWLGQLQSCPCAGVSEDIDSPGAPAIPSPRLHPVLYLVTLLNSLGFNSFLKIAHLRFPVYVSSICE